MSPVVRTAVSPSASAPRLPKRRGRRWGGAAMTVAALLPPLLTVAPSSPAAAADPTNPHLELTAPSRAFAYSYSGGVYADYGFQLEVRGAPLEIWTQRAPDYRTVPAAVAKLPLGDVALPEQTRVGTLNKFLRLRIVKRGDDAQPIRRRLSTCLDEAVRLSPDADFRNPYPQSCYYNPYAIGSVQGVPSGWAANVIDFDSRLPLEPGTYDMTVWIARGYATALGMNAEERTASTVLVVKKGEDCYECVAGPRDVRRTPNRTEPDPDGGIDTVADLPPGTPTPDLRSLPAFGIRLNGRGTQLQFSANVWNAGNSPLVVDGFRRTGEDVMDAYQYFLDADGNQVAYRPVGTMVWHPAPSHNHWHFTDFATYELLSADKTRAVRSRKESFCLANTDAVDLTGAGAAWEAYEEDLGSVCGGYETRSIREVLSAGWGDTYTQVRAGQSFRIKNLPDGVYFVRVLANPDDRLVETDTTNNESLRRVRLFTNALGKRKVRVSQVGLVSDEDVDFRTR